jgi:hypothetical protein
MKLEGKTALVTGSGKWQRFSPPTNRTTSPVNQSMSMVVGFSNSSYAVLEV